MSVFKTFTAILAAFFRTSGWMAIAAIVGAALSLAGTILLGDMVQSAAGEHVDDSGATVALLLPAIIAHAIFLVVISQIAAGSSRSVRFGKRQMLGVVAIVILIAAVFVSTSQLPEPLPFLAPLAVTAILAWTPLVPAVAVGRMQWSPARFVTAVLISLPFLVLAEVFGVEPQGVAVVGEGFGMFEGGIITWPLLGLHLFLLSATAAIVPTVVYATPQPPATAILS